jgi:hypothetical protein
MNTHTRAPLAGPCIALFRADAVLIGDVPTETVSINAITHKPTQNTNSLI